MMMAFDLLIVVAVVASLVCAGATVYSFIKNKPTPKVTFRTDGTVEAFSVTTEEAEKLKKILLRDLREDRRRHHRNTATA